MSISTEISRLTNLRNNIRTKLINLGLLASGSTADLQGCYDAINGVTKRSSSDLTASGATVSVPAGLYSSAASKSVASGTQGTPTATKGTVSSNQISITPTCTDTTGYITGSTKTGTAVVVKASDLVSGTKSISANGTGIDVTNYAAVTVNVPTGTARSSSDLTVSGATVSVPAGLYSTAASKSVASGSATTPATTITANPSLSTTYTSGSGYKMSVSATKDITPTVSAGYVSSGTSGKITVSGSAYVAQSAVTSGQSLPSGGSSAGTAGYGKYAKVSAGYYPSDRYIGSGVSAGSVTVGTPTINTSTGVVTGTASVTAGYVSGTPASKTLALSTQAATTITPGTSAKTAVAAGKYTTGAVTVAGDANLIAGNIKSGVSIFGVTGSFEGSSEYRIVVSTGLAFLSKATVTSTKLSVTGASVSGSTFIVP